MRKGIILFIIIVFFVNTIVPCSGSVASLPLTASSILLKGIKVYPNAPFRFDFIVSPGGAPEVPLREFRSGSGTSGVSEGDLQRLIKYFLASLTLPEQDLWVNLSPYEKDRMMTSELAQTQMGRDMLAQDEALKQLASSSIDPQKDLGRVFWDRVYAQAREDFGTDDIPMDMFNKVWVLADEATVLEQGNVARVVSAHMKVMLESDVMLSAAQRSEGAERALGRADEIGRKIFRQIILPEIEKEVNTGKDFATLREIFHSFILATWFKKRFKEALLNEVYSDRKKTGSMEGGLAPDAVYDKYLQAYKTGAFSFIKEEPDPLSGQIVPRRYFSGGYVLCSEHIRFMDGSGQLTGHLAREDAAEMVVGVRLDPAEDSVLRKEDWKKLMEEGRGLADELIAFYDPNAPQKTLFDKKFMDGVGNGLSNLRGTFSLALSGQLFLQHSGLRSASFVMAGIHNALKLLNDDVYRLQWMQWAPENFKYMSEDKVGGEFSPDASWVAEKREALKSFAAVYERVAPRLNRLIDFIYDNLAVDPPEGITTIVFPPDYEMKAYVYNYFPDFSETTADLLKKAETADEAGLKAIYQQLAEEPKGAGRAIYDALHNHMGMRLIEVDDLVQAAREGRREFFKACKEWALTKGKDPKAMMKIVFATGKSPELMYKFIVEYLNMDWTDPEVRALLESEGIDPDHKPDMSRAISFHLDTVLPQKRSAYFAFARIVKKWVRDFRIPERKENQHYFYGDVALDADGTLRSMTPKEFKRFMDDVARNGIKVKDFVAGTLDKDKYRVQYEYFTAMRRQNQEMSAKLKALGGPDIVFGSVGPSNEGQGHVGFVESDDVDAFTALLAEANHHLIASQAAQGGGYQQLLGRMGVATFSLADITQNPDARFIMIILDSKKKVSVRRGVEGTLGNDKDAPLVHLQGMPGALIIDGGSGSELLVNQYPWDFRVIPAHEWTDELRREFFVRSALRAGTQIDELTPDDFLFFEKDKTHPMVQWVRRQNMHGLLESGSFDDQKKAMAARLGHNTIRAADVVEEQWGTAYVKAFEEAKSRLAELEQMGASQADLDLARARVLDLRKTIVCPDPHPDDRFLADPGFIQELIAQGHRVITVTATSGASSVGDQLVAAMLSHMRALTVAQIKCARATSREELSRRLLELVPRERPLDWEERLDFNAWDKMSREEQDLRTQLLLNYLDQKIIPGRFFQGEGGEKVAQHDIRKFVHFVQAQMNARPAWGSATMPILDDIKGTIRLIEEKNAMLSWGVAYNDIYDLIKPSWYTSAGKVGTASPQDIAVMVELFKKAGRVDAVFGNGEGFSDFDAHSSTEATVIATLFALQEEGFLSPADFRYITYAGVWERISAGQADMTIVYTKEDLDRLHRRFWQFYLSQAPTQQPDASYDRLMLYSESVAKNGRLTAEELLSLIRLPQDLNDVLAQGGIALNFQVKNIFDPRVKAALQAKIDKLDEVREPLKQISRAYGPLPSKDPGGILFDAAQMNLETQGGGEVPALKIDPALIERYRQAPGLVPVILSVKGQELR